MNKLNQPNLLSNASDHVGIVEKELTLTAEYLGIDKEKLQIWLTQYPLTQTTIQLSFLHLIKKYDLDPFADELSIIKNTDGSGQVLISVDGWFKIINQQHQFAGLSLRESTQEKNGIPLWMECSIYRHDRILPTVIKEYFEEVKSEHITWISMPRRMLRHRAIQQCARLAFGIRSSEAHLHELNKKLSNQPLEKESGLEDLPKKGTSKTELLKQQLKS